MIRRTSSVVLITSHWKEKYRWNAELPGEYEIVSIKGTWIGDAPLPTSICISRY